MRQLNSKGPRIFLCFLCAFALSVAEAPVKGECNGSLAAANIVINTYPASPIQIDIVAFASGSGGRPVHMAGVTSPAAGSVAIDADEGLVTYSPAPNADGASFTYTVQDTSGATASASVLIGNSAPPPPPPPPQPNEGAVPFDVTCSSLDCDFLAHPTALQAGNIKQWVWTFGDSISSGRNDGQAHHHYENPSPQTGTLTSLTLTYFSGLVYTSSKTIFVTAPSTFDPFWTYNSQTDPASLVINFFPRNPNQRYFEGDWKDVIYEWHILDSDPNGSWSCQPRGCKSPTFTYSRPGAFRVVLRLLKQGLNAGELAAYGTDVVVSNAPPTARFSAAAPTCSTCAFSAAGSSDEWALDPLRGIARYEWDFGDGEYLIVPSVGTAPAVQTASHAYRAGGPKTVRLRAVDAFGASSASYAASVTVPNDAPLARFEYDCEGAACRFDPSSSSDDHRVASYSWAVNDQSTWTTDEPRAFTTKWTTGSYAVSLTVTDEQGASSSFSRLVTIQRPASGPLRFFAVTPCRLFDSRSSTPLLGGLRRTFHASGRCGVPGTARVVQVTPIIVGPTGSGYLQLWGFEPAPITTVVNFTPLRSPIAGNTIVNLDAAGDLTALATTDNALGTANLVVDVTGYFTEDGHSEDPSAAKGPLAFQSLAPCRVLDSREKSQPLTAGQPRYLQVAGLSSCGIAPDAAAAALNLTLISPTATGNAVLYKSDLVSPPVASSINVVGGVNRANAALIGLGKSASDDLALLYSSSVGATSHFTLDVSGYFSPTAPLRYYSLPQACRAVDTRDPRGGDVRLTTGGTYDYQIAGNCGVPRGAAAAAVDIVAVRPDGPGNLAVRVSEAAGLNPSVLNFSGGEAIQNGLIVPLSPQQRDLTIRPTVFGTGAGGLDLIVDVVGYFAGDLQQGAGVWNEEMK